MDIKRDYYEDITLFTSNVVKFWFAVLIVALICFPFVVLKLKGSSYYIYLANYIAINVIVTIGLNILVGYTGQISLGHAGFFAIGAYMTILGMSRFHIPFFPAIILAGLISAFFGFLLGIPALRLEGPYLAIATLGFGMAITETIGRWQFFGGRMGLEAPPLDILRPLGSFVLKSDTQKYFLFISICVFLTWCARNIMKTRIGRAFIAIRDSDIAAQTIGINLTLYKTMAFAVSAFYTAIAGGLMAFLLGFINPSSFNFILSIYFLAFVIVGGIGSISGSVMGGILMSILMIELEKIQELPYLGHLIVTISERWMDISGIHNISSIIFGLIIILIVVVEPLGLYGFWIRTKLYWKTWPF